MHRRQLVFTHGCWQRVQHTLFAQSGCEGFAFGLARPCRRDNGLAYVVENILELNDADYELRSAGGITTSQACSNRINQIAADAAHQGVVPVHLHSHPVGIDNFSHYDDHHERLSHQWLQLKQQPFICDRKYLT